MLRLLVGWLLLVGALPSTPPPRSVDLTFRWPDQLSCDVVMSSHTSGMPDGRPGFNGSVKYRLVARRRGDGWVITRGGVPNGGMPGSASPRTSPALPSFSVRADGSFDRLVLDEAARAYMVQEDLRRSAALPKGMPFISTEQTARQQAAAEWTPLVGDWQGVHVQIGLPISRRSEGDFEVPTFGPLHTRRTERYTWKSWQPCPGRIVCVELESIVQPEVADIQRLIEKARATMAGQLAGSRKVDITGLTVRRVLVTDPATLLPRKLTIRYEIDALMTPAVKGEQRLHLITERSDTFSCGW